MFKTLSRRVGQKRRERKGTKQEIGMPTSRRVALFQPKTASALDTSEEMDRTLYQMPVPENTDALTDLMKLHKAGDKLPYVGIVGKEGESLDARRSRLLALKPEYNLRNIPEIEVAGCPLIDNEGEFTMMDLIEHAKISQVQAQPISGIQPRTASMKDFTISRKFVHIRSVTGLFTPNMSSTSDYCKLWFTLSDIRMVNTSKSGQSSAIVSNQEGVMELSCDYCISAIELTNFVLTYTLERDIVKPGFQWGTVTFYFNLTESDLPYQSAKRDALAVYRMPITTLTERNVSADKSDITFTPADIHKLRELYRQGDIVDVDQAQEARLKKSSYSKTTLRGEKKGEVIESANRDGWDFMSGARKGKLDAEIASESAKTVSEDDINPKELLSTRDAWEVEQERIREEFLLRAQSESSKTMNSEREPKLEREGSEKEKKNSLDLARKKVGFNLTD